MQLVDTDKHGLTFRMDYPATLGASSYTTYSINVFPCRRIDAPDDHALFAGVMSEHWENRIWLLCVDMHGNETRREYFEDLESARALYLELVDSFTRNCSAIGNH